MYKPSAQNFRIHACLTRSGVCVWNGEGARGYSDFCLLQGLGLFMFCSKILIPLFFGGVEVLLTIFMVCQYEQGFLGGYAIFHVVFCGV